MDWDDFFMRVKNIHNVRKYPAVASSCLVRSKTVRYMP